jgi:hypothetical protein
VDNLTQDDIYEILQQTLPKQNDFSETNYSEELQELIFFGINTKIALLDMVVKHRETVLQIDAEPLDEYHIKWYSDDYGKDYVQDRIKNKFWFAYPGLLRIILELEFGDKYIKYADKRDKIG